jgi:aromatic ring-opening dioxygenase LigB subunit
MAVTRRAMEDLGRRCLRARPDTLVVFTPHGLCLENCISVSMAVSGAGYLDGENGVRVGMHFLIDQELSEAIGAEAQKRDVPAAMVGYQQDGSAMPVFPLDWGVLVPAFFLGAQWPQPPQIVVACPDRSLPREKLIAFGEAVVSAAARTGRRIAIVCSADQGHGHSEDGPYGYSPQSAVHDDAYCTAVRENALERLLSWSNDDIEASMTDSYWQTLMLLGALRMASLKPQMLSYEAPTYFGMACVAFEPEGLHP